MLGKSAFTFVALLALSLPAVPQGSNCLIQGVTAPFGVSGNADEGGPEGPSWLAQLAAWEDYWHILPTCTYTYIPPVGPGNPNSYYWIGDCLAVRYICFGTPPPPPPSSGSDGNGGCGGSGSGTGGGGGSPGPTPGAMCGKPINLSNGNTFIEQTDILLPGLGGGLALTRTWNSLWPASQTLMAVGLFGNKWKSTYEERAFQGSDGTIKYARSTGNFWSFQVYSLNSGPVAYRVIAPANAHATLTINSTQWTITFPNGEQRAFDPSTGLLTAITDRNGNTTHLSYDSSQRLTTVTDAASRHLYFTYGSPSGYLVTGVSSDVGLSWTYSYDIENRLSQITKPDQTTINFTYNAQSLITSVTDSQGKVLESHAYDSFGRGLTSSQANGVNAVTVSYGSNP